MNLDKDSFSSVVQAMLHRLERCVNSGTPMEDDDWQTLLLYLLRIAEHAGSVEPIRAVENVLVIFLGPNDQKWSPSEGPLGSYFQRIMCQVCHLQAPSN